MNVLRALAGAVIAGISIATGNPILVATAASIGVNWLADDLATLWPEPGGRRTAPLTEAFAISIRSAVSGLAEEYRRTVDPKADMKAFDLVKGIADALADAEVPRGVASLAEVEQALDADLLDVLHGHDERQVEYLRKRLLPACTAAFQEQLVVNDAAWREFHGAVLRALAANSVGLQAKLDRFTEVLARWSDPEAGRVELEKIVSDRNESGQQPFGTATFANQGMTVKGDVYQAAKNQYFNSAHAEGGGTAASVTNIIGAPVPRKWHADEPDEDADSSDD